MNSGAGDTTQLVPGFPIRTPWDHSSVDSSPRPIAASHVLHRLLVPRHPPFALANLTTENKMLASTVQFSTNDQPTTLNAPHQPRPQPDGMRSQIVPGIEDQPRGFPHNGCSFRYPTGCYVFVAYHQPHQASRSTPSRAVLAEPAVAGS